MYEVNSYYDDKLRGLESNVEIDDNFCEVEAVAHEKLMNGLVVLVRNTTTGIARVIKPDDYINTFEGEFPYTFLHFEEARK